MSRLWRQAATAGNPVFLLLLALAVGFLPCPDIAPAQERTTFHIPDSIRTRRDSFFTPSMSPAFSYIPPTFMGSQLPPFGQPAIDETFSNSHHDAWKRSFLLGATNYRASIYQPSPWLVRKETFFQKIQAAIGVAELAGAAYLGYKAIKKEPITKRKK